MKKQWKSAREKNNNNNNIKKIEMGAIYLYKALIFNDCSNQYTKV